MPRESWPEGRLRDRDLLRCEDQPDHEPCEDCEAAGQLPVWRQLLSARKACEAAGQLPLWLGCDQHVHVFQLFSHRLQFHGISRRAALGGDAS